MGGLTRLARAGAASVPGLNLVPGVRKSPPSEFERLTVSGGPRTVDPEHVARYASVCGFPRRDTLPLTYPHLVAFEQQMEIMASPRFPWAALGSVHVENTIVSYRPIGLHEQLASSVSVGRPRPHAKGELLDFTTTVTSGGETVWEEVSAYLVRGRGHEDAPAGLDLGPAPRGTTTWHLPGDLGRRYAAVSGDLNPIHLYPVTARALGFRRQIAHGMWTAAHALAEVENRLPGAVRVEVAFKRPVLLPGTVAFGLEGDRDLLRFGLTSPADGSPHLVGRATAL